MSDPAKVRIRLARLRQRRGGAAAHNKLWEQKNPEKAAAHKTVEVAVRLGKLVRQPCEVCHSTTRIHAHHDDYSKPLDVMWLCPLHHKQRHKELEAA
jgi:hypothetical protein